MTHQQRKGYSIIVIIVIIVNIVHIVAVISSHRITSHHSTSHTHNIPQTSGIPVENDDDKDIFGLKAGKSKASLPFVVINNSYVYRGGCHLDGWWQRCHITIHTLVDGAPSQPKYNSARRIEYFRILSEQFCCVNKCNFSENGKQQQRITEHQLRNINIILSQFASVAMIWFISMQIENQLLISFVDGAGCCWLNVT